MLFRSPTLSPSRTAAPAATRGARSAGRPRPAPRVSRYLTDGHELYRFLGALASGAAQLVVLENCRSLDLSLIPLRELAARLHGVVPAAGDQ